MSPALAALAWLTIAQEVTWQLAEAASQAAVLQLAATQAARVSMRKTKEEACDLFVT